MFIFSGHVNTHRKLTRSASVTPPMSATPTSVSDWLNSQDDMLLKNQSVSHVTSRHAAFILDASLDTERFNLYRDASCGKQAPVVVFSSLWNTNHFYRSSRDVIKLLDVIGSRDVISCWRFACRTSSSITTRRPWRRATRTRR